MFGPPDGGGQPVAAGCWVRTGVDLKPKEEKSLNRIVSGGIVVFAGLLVTPLAQTPHLLRASEPVSAKDPRLPILKQFLEENGAPVARHAEVFLKAADDNDLDWRLLPSLSIIESSGGRFCRNNNIFGWGNGQEVFPSVRAGIHQVADRLANSKLYKDKTLEQILRTYNANADYAARVKRVMRSIGPANIPISLVN